MSNTQCLYYLATADTNYGESTSFECQCDRHVGKMVTIYGVGKPEYSFLKYMEVTV